MNKYCFVMKIKEEHINDYINIHKNAWPELLSAAKNAGAENLVIFIDRSNSIVFIECEDLNQFYEKYGKMDAVISWNEVTKPWIEQSPRIDGSGSVASIEKVFDLREQLEGV